MKFIFFLFIGTLLYGAASAQSIASGMPATGGSTTSPYGKSGTGPRRKPVHSTTMHHGAKKRMTSANAVKPKKPMAKKPKIVQVDDGTPRP